MLELLLNPSHQFFKFKFEDGSFDVGHDSVFSNHPGEKMSSEEEYILYWPNDSSVSTRKVSRKTKCRRLAARVMYSSVIYIQKFVGLQFYWSHLIFNSRWKIVVEVGHASTCHDMPIPAWLRSSYLSSLILHHTQKKIKSNLLKLFRYLIPAVYLQMLIILSPKYHFP